MNFELLLAAFGSPQDLARPKEIQNGEMLHLGPHKITCCNSDGLNVEILKTAWRPGGPKQIKANLGVQQHGVATTAQHEIGETSDSRPQELAHDIRAIPQNSQYVGANGPPSDSRPIGGANDGAHRCARDGDGANPHFVQGF